MDLLNPADIGIAVIFAFCVVRGFFRGFIKEIFSLLGALAGFYAACIYFPDLTRLLIRWVPKFPYLNIISFILLFISVFILISLMGVGIKYLLNIIFLRWVDRACGALFGALKGVLIGSVFLLASTAFVPQFESMIKSSKLAPEVTRVTEKMISIVPFTVKEQFYDKLKEFKKAWQT